MGSHQRAGAPGSCWGDDGPVKCKYTGTGVLVGPGITGISGGLGAPSSTHRPGSCWGGEGPVQCTLLQVS